MSPTRLAFVVGTAVGEESRKSMSSFLWLRIYGYNPVGIQWIKKKQTT